MERRAFTQFTLTSVSSVMDAIRRIQEAGFATIKEELEVGLLSIAVPTKNRRDETVASQARFRRLHPMQRHFARVP
jgi:IclR family pca regulon transcriptional regulator